MDTKKAFMQKIKEIFISETFYNFFLFFFQLLYLIIFFYTLFTHKLYPQHF